MHPSWYYTEYSKIFSWSRNYSKEINMINDIVLMENKIIEEIGAGTGKHTEEILRMNPLKLRAIDYDDQSIKLLIKKFVGMKNVQILKEDGFVRNNSADIIICLYSIVQQTENESILKKRIENLLYRVEKYNCDLFIECIDTEKHDPHGFISIYESEKTLVGIKSEKTDFGIKIIYQGYINNRNITYEIPICNCPLHIFEINSNIKYEIIPLTHSMRKRIIHLFRCN